MRRPRLGAVVALVVLPLSLSTSQPMTDATSADARPGGEHRATYASSTPAEPSRYATRFALLDQATGAMEDGLLPAEHDPTEKVKVSSPKGTHVWTASAMSDGNIPAAAVRAYKNAAASMAKSDPACQLPWTLLAAIGRVESDHGRYGGSVLARDGVSHPLIIGVPLNGVGPVAAIPDSDGGRLDKDKVWDRAVGPMQFIPTTWAGAARDGDGDGVMTPNDIDDAALAAAGYLCSGTGSVKGKAGMAAAIFRYNHDDYYVKLVMALERGYRDGVFVLPSAPVPADDEKDRSKKDKKRDKKKAGDRPTKKPTKKPGKKPSSSPTSTPTKPTTPTSKPSPTPTKPTPTKPSPTPTKPTPTKPTPTKPTPTKPALATVSGTWKACEAASGWCLDSKALDLGPVELGADAADDFDGDEKVETNGQEFEGLAGKSVTLQVENKPSGTAVVYVINGMDYRFADGTLA